MKGQERSGPDRLNQYEQAIGNKRMAPELNSDEVEKYQRRAKDIERLWPWLVVASLVYPMKQQQSLREELALINGMLCEQGLLPETMRKDVAQSWRDSVRAGVRARKLTIY